VCPPKRVGIERRNGTPQKGITTDTIMGKEKGRRRKRKRGRKGQNASEKVNRKYLVLKEGKEGGGEERDNCMF
jgi:hypothetical protein